MTYTEKLTYCLTDLGSKPGMFAAHVLGVTEKSMYEGTQQATDKLDRVYRLFKLAEKAGIPKTSYWNMLGEPLNESTVDDIEDTNSLNHFFVGVDHWSKENLLDLIFAIAVEKWDLELKLEMLTSDRELILEKK